jgi:hypothetical protein
MRNFLHLLHGKKNRCEPSLLERSGPIQAPSNFNNPPIAKFSPEVSGRILLNSMCQRLGWRSLAGKRLLDFGCGVRFAQTLSRGVAAQKSG